MSAPQFPLSLVFNVSASAPQPGVGLFNTSNVALFSREVANLPTFGTLGYQLYSSALQVGKDFGTNSNTYLMAVNLFAQKPNILANGGYLVIFPFLATAQTAVQKVAFPLSSAGLPASAGTFELTFGGNNTTPLAFNSTAAQVQTALQLVPGLGTVTVTGGPAPGSFLVTMTGIVGPAALMTISANSLVDSLANVVLPVVTTTVIGAAAETVDQAVLRTQGIVSYFGVMSAEIPSQAVMLLAASLIQSLNKIALWVSNTPADVLPGGMIDLLRTGSMTQNRGLYYEDTLANALGFMAAYAGMGFSTVFLGSNTTQTMHLKTLANVQPDPNLGSGGAHATLAQCQAAGADVYINIQGVSKTYTSGANDFFDNQNNLQWFVGALQVGSFNVLATTNTKIPQTENGMNILKGASRVVCEQAVTNAFAAPGQWNNPDTFGNQGDLITNVSQRGYYIFSAPIAQQLQAQRAARVAPLIQIALKYAGAIHSGTVLVNVNP